MLSRVNLVAILLMLNCVIHTMGYTRSQQEKRPEEERAVASGKKILRRYTHSNVTSVTTLPTKAVIADDKSTKIHVQDIHSTQSKTAGKKRDKPLERKKRHMKKMGKMMTGLLMAYKLKFVALIPTMIGGLLLLKSTTLLAGFFFALFAAVLGLKIH